MIPHTRSLVGSLLGLFLLGSACKTAQTNGGTPDPQKTTSVPVPSTLPTTKHNKPTPCSNHDNIDYYNEHSKYGKFNKSIGNENKECMMIFESSIGKQKRTDIIDVGCTPGEDDSLLAMGCVGNIELPYLASNGDEFHVFFNEYCGNGGCEISYWVSIVNNENIWSTKDSFGGEFESFAEGGGATIDAAETKEKDGHPVLSLIFSPTSTSDGISYDVSMGKLEKTLLKKLKRTVTSKDKVTIIGIYSSGIKPSEYKDFVDEGDGIDDSGPWNILDKTGDCPQLEKLYNTKVKMIAESTTYSDGTTELECVSVKAVQ